MNVKKISFASLALLSCLFADQTLAAAASATSHATAAAVSGQEFQLLPVLDVWGYTGKHTLGDAQVLVPLIGDQNKVFYVAGEGKVASKHNGWMAGGGLGYRQVIEQRIYGAYVVADQNNALDNRRFLVVNPGIESLGMAWDFRVNGYFPTKRSWDEHEQYVDFEDHCGIYDDSRFEKHKQFDRQTLVTKDGEIVSGLGADAEIGRTIPVIDNLKAFVGGYYFNNKDAGHVGGASARITWQATNNLGVEVIDTYDNQRRNTALLGIKVSLGGFGKDDVKKFGIAARLMDPIEHNIATAANGYAVPVLQDVKVRYHKFGAEILEHDNIWFFKQGAAGTNGTSASAATGDGTYENPFIGFNQSNVTVVSNNFGNIGAIKDKYPLLYFAPGTYSLTGQGFTTDGRFSLPLGWGMYGRNLGYNAPAFGDERELFEGGIDIMPATALLQDDSDNNTFVTTLNSIRILNDQAVNVTPFSIIDSSDLANAALFIKDAGTVVIKNSVIDSSVQTQQSSGSDAAAIYLENAVLNFEKLDCRHTGDTLVHADSIGNVNGVSYGIVAAAQNSTTVASSLAQSSNETTIINFNGGNNTIESESSAYAGDEAGIYAISFSNIAGSIANFAINFNNGNNKIVDTNSNVIGTSNGMIIYSAADNGSTSNAAVRFNGGNNAIQANGTTARGLYTFTNTVTVGDNATMDFDFNGGNNLVLANGSMSGFGFYSLAGGVGSSVMSLNFNGGENNIFASNETIPHVGYGVYYTAGSAASKAYINFNGGKNNITAKSSETETVLGIFATATGKEVISFNGGENNISALGGLNSFAIKAQANSGGQLNMIFNGGENTLTSTTGSADDSIAAGIYAQAADADGIDIQFLNANNSKVKFISNVVDTSGSSGQKRYGIDADADTKIIDGSGTTITTAARFNAVADFISMSTDSATLGDPVFWTGHTFTPNIQWQLQE